MILWFNCKITDTRVSNLGVNMRQKLRQEKRFDVARYTFASFAPLEPILSKVLFNLELDVDCLGKEKEMEEWIYSIFPSEKIRLQWFRCNNLQQWKNIQNEINDIDDNLIYPAGNDDHLFFDSNINLFKLGLSYLENDTDITTMLCVCHYPEAMRDAFIREHTLSPCQNIVSFRLGTSVNVFVIKKELFGKYVECITDPDQLIYKTDAISINWQSKILLPTKEICRHFDGYAHTAMNSNHCPPLEIPHGFFDKKIIIKYGFKERFPDCVNINPISPTLYAADAKGTDYKFALSDIPAFWHPYISQIDINPEIDHEQIILHRNQHYVDIATAHFSGGRSHIPFHWIHNHML